MAQADYSISNQGFPATRADINSHLEAIATNNSGTSAPSTQYAGQFWIDTTSSTWTLYIHDGADDIQFATIDTSANTVNFIDSELGDNSVTTAKIADGNVTSAKLSYPLTTFSSTGIDDNATSTAITIDSSENVGIGTSSPESTLHVVGTNRLFSPLRIQPASNNGNSAFSIRQDATQDRLTLGLAYSSSSAVIGHRVKPSNVSESDATGFLSSSTSNVARTAMRFDTSGHIQFYNAPQQNTAVDSVVAMTESMRINSDGRVGIGITSPANTLDVDGGFKLSGNAFLGGGIYLNGETGTANKLDDYEEGTYTATITTSTGTSVPLTSIKILSYTKIGRKVHIQGLIRLATISSLSGAFFQISLPFTTATSSTITLYGGRGGGAITFVDDSAGGASSTIPFRFAENSTKFTVNKDSSTLGTSDDLYISLSFFTD